MPGNSESLEVDLLFFMRQWLPIEELWTIGEMYKPALTRFDI